TGRWNAGTPFIARPRRSTSPPSGCSKPAIILSVVVLPHPDGPRRAKNSPSAMSRSISSTASTRPAARLSTNSLVRAVSLTAGTPGWDAVLRVVTSAPSVTPGSTWASAPDEYADLVPSLVEQRLTLLVLFGEEQPLPRLGSGVDPRVVRQLFVDEPHLEGRLVRRAVGGVVRDVGAHLWVEDVVDERLGQRLVRRSR